MDENEQLSKRLESIQLSTQPAGAGSLTGLVDILRRQVRPLLIVFAAAVAGAMLAGLTRAPRFEADLKVLVLHNREEPSVSTGVNSVAQTTLVSEEELNSEVELFKSRDLLQKVVEACQLDQMNDVGIRDHIKRIFLIKTAPSSKPQRVEQAVDKLDRDLKVKALRKTNLIDATYTSRDPDLSVKVLSELAALYLQKHVDVHRIPGALLFFTRETRRYQDELAASTQELSDFTRRSGVGSALEERDRTAEKLVGFEADMRQAEADVHDREQRRRVLNVELKQTPERFQTQVRRSDNGALLQQMKSGLLDRELKRSQLAVTFNAGYPPLRELDAEIAATKSAIKAQESSPVREESSDVTPTHTFLVEELAKTNADLASRRAQAEALADVVHHYRTQVSELGQRTIQQADLERNMKTAEANYLLYRSKLEDSRISDALDRNTIVNVSIAQPPIKPQRSIGLSLGLILGIGVIFGACASVGSAYLIDGMATTFRTTVEVEELLGLLVLAVVPELKAP